MKLQIVSQIISLTKKEIEQFAKLYRHDARPTQPLNDRVVLESK
jgi:carbonic anhydrase